MALQPGSIVTSLLLLLMAQDSWQQSRDFTNCPTESLDYPDVPENPQTTITLFTASNTRLNLTDSAGGYLGLTTTNGNPAVYIAKNLDYEVKPDISGSVRCFDTAYPNGITLTVHIIVQDVNEYPPQFNNTSYSVSIREDTALGSTVFRFKGEATDRDTTPNQYISYTVSKNPTFSIANSQEGSIVLGIPLDFENGQRTFVLNISAIESTGNPRPLSNTTTLTINVSDVDDLGPVFNNTSYTLTIDERTYNGQQYRTVPPLAAVDGDTLRAVINLTLDASSMNQFGSMFEVKTDGTIAVTGAVYPGNFTINVRAFQQNRPSDRFIITTVFVSVRDINDNSPSMSRRSYTAEVSEEARPGSFVVAVSATDLDQGNNAHFLFHLDNNNNNVFNISTDGTLGIITVAGRLDRETQETYTLQVYAQEDMTSERRNSSKSAVIITIADANDNSPVFQSASYSFAVKQTDAAGQVVGRVIATDLDKGENGRVTFSITSPSGAFRIDSNTGQITTQRTLIKADVGLVSLLVKADDNAVSHQRSTVAQVTVNVTSVNQFSQFINPTSYNFSVNEDAPVGFSVGTVQATDRDGDNLQYSLQTADAAFELRGDPPTLYVKQSLDLDVGTPKTLHTMHVQVTDGKFTASASVSVSVQYVNEFSPSFSKSVYSGDVMENATQGTRIVQLSANDEDKGNSDGIIAYSITENKDTAPVAINGDWLVTLNCGGCLDYNVKIQYVIVVEAKDGGNPPKTARASVIVWVQDINNKAPRFESPLFLGTVQENLDPGHTIMQLQARDDDTAGANLVFTIESGNASRLLRMDRSYLVTDTRLDAEMNQFVTGVVRVSDGVQSNTTNINITVVDVNDNDPQLTLTPNPVLVPENTRTGTALPVQITATDSDITKNGFTFWLEGSAGKFSINHTSGDVTVVGAFDRRLQLSYDVQVYVSDNGSPPRISSARLRVNITDSNTAPVFWDSSNRPTVSYAFNVSEDKTVSTVVGAVRAYDPDSGSSGQLRYSVVPTDGSGTFLLNEATGELTLQRELDYETTKSYRLTVRVTDNSFEPKSATATVSVSVLNVEEAPYWPSPFPVVTLTQSDQCGGSQGIGRPRVVGTYTAISRAASGVTYSLVNLTTTFTMDNNTGLIQTRIGTTVTIGTHNLGLRACTTGSSVCSDTAVTLNVTNDDVITFCPPFLTVYVNESSPTGHVVADLNSTKGDNGVTYSFVGQAPEKFTIDPATGVVTLNSKLDRETTSQYNLLISAVYRLTSGTVTAQVTVNVEDAPDTPPKFAPNTYEGEINESASIGDYVTSIGGSQSLVLSATDRDTNPTLSFSITGDNSGGSFKVNTTTGTITLMNKIDLEKMNASLNDRYTLKVMVSDGYFNDTATVVIRVLNDNDNNPQFIPATLALTVNESQQAPYAITTLSATDGDVVDRGHLRFTVQNASLPFSVGESSGLLTLNGRLDRETTDFYSFSVIATDPGGKIGSMTINITVADANDQNPVFDSANYTLVVVEGSAGIGYNVTVSAHDNDLGDNAKLSFSIDSGDSDGAFNVTSARDSKAVIRVVKALDREASPTISLVVKATDGGQPPLTGTCKVEVQLLDINDNPPQFSPNRYSASVSEGAANNTRVQMAPVIAVTDRDTGLFGQAGVVFSLLSGNSTLPFRIDQKSAGLFVSFDNSNQRLDRENTSTYTLTVVATDNNGAGLSSTAVVVVALTDVNDHPPEFRQPYYSWAVPEDVQFGHVIDTVTATDRDVSDGDVNPLRYSIQRGGEGKFFMDRLTGRVQVAGPLDRETGDHYQLILFVTDGQLNASVAANVTVEDANDNCPVFRVPSPLLLSVQEEQPSTIIYNISATDSDLGNNGTVDFFMNDTAMAANFSLSPTGQLRLVPPLDLENGTPPSLAFTVWARDRGQPSCMTSLPVRVEIKGKNEFTPEVCELTLTQQTLCSENFTITAYNGSLAGMFLAVLRGRDRDAGEDGHVTITLTSDAAQLLAYNPSTGILTLKNPINIDDLTRQRFLDADNSTYSAKVTATDGGNPARNAVANVTVRVLPRAPNTPVFTRNVYNFSTPENHKDFAVGGVVAVLPGLSHQFVYRVEGNTDFAVDNQGNITTARQLDREMKDQYTLLVLAWGTDGQSTTASTVVLVTVTDENDNNPAFSSSVYDVTLDENTDYPDFLNLSATDNDIGENGRVAFTLLNYSSLAGPFLLDAKSGHMSLNGTLDREQRSSYVLIVKAADGGSPPRTATASVRVTVLDLNDNSPAFPQDNYVVTLDENSPPSTQVVNVTAEDRDEGKAGQVVYGLQGGDNVFYINEFTGVIYTSRAVNYEEETIFTLYVRARDLGPSPRSSTATVTVYVNNLPDVVPQLTFDLDPPRVALVLGTHAGTRIPLSVSASGASGNFTFNITAGNERGLFAIDERTGEMRVAAELTSTAQYTLTIRAANADATQYYTTGQVVVTVTAVTLGQETYTAVRRENENSNLPALVLDITSNAEHVGIPVIYTLTLENSKDPFYIQNHTGQIYCSASLDREARARYRMKVSVDLDNNVATSRTARDVSKTADVDVIVDDVNDNAPTFEDTSRIFGIPDKAPAYTFVTTLKATDQDAGANGQLTYRVTKGDTNEFSVTQQGEVRSLRAMSDVTKKSFDLTVTASDNGQPPQTSAPMEIKIVVVPSTDLFGLVANKPVVDINSRRDFYIRNLSSILSMTLHLDKVEPHQGTTVDTSKSDIYFYAFDDKGSPILFSTIQQRVNDNAEAIRQLFASDKVDVIMVTETPERVRVVVEYKMGVAEIAVLVVSCLIFLVSLVAILIVYRAWKKQKAFQEREQAAAKARQRLEQETRELAEKMQETTFVADPEEPLELSRTRVPLTEDEQECVLYLGNESTGLDTVALRRAVKKRETDTDSAKLEALLEECEDEEMKAADSGLDVGPGNDGSMSSSEDGVPGPRTPCSSPSPGAESGDNSPLDHPENGGRNSSDASATDSISSPANTSGTSRLSQPVSSSSNAGVRESIDYAVVSRATENPTSDAGGVSMAREDPKPDYPDKKVSFSGARDAQKERMGGGGPGGDTVDGAQDGWQHDYDSNELPTHDMITEL